MAIEPDFLDLLPLFPTETEDTIRARWQAWANEGLTVDDSDEWVDVREGGMFSIGTEGGIREVARVYDLMGTEFPAATFPLYTWGSYQDDVALGYRLERLAATPASGVVTFTGAVGTVIDPGFTVGVEGSIEGAKAKEYEVTEGGTIPGGGSIDLVVVAVAAGAATDAGAHQVTLPLSAPLSGAIETIDNAEPMIGGTDPETDEALRERLLAAFEGKGPGNIHDYEVWARAFSNDIGLVTVIPIWNGPGTVKVIILTAQGGVVPTEIVEGLKAFLDPVAGLGHGQAPVGHDVTVETATQVSVKVEADVTWADGYSADGEGGTIAMRAQLEAAVADYIRSEPPGGEVVLTKVIGRLVGFTAIHDVPTLKLNGSAANISLSDNPAEVGFLDELVLS